jgi:hypothetical protein
MIVFKVIGKDKDSGEKKTILIGAESEFRAAQLAREKGLVPTSITAEDMEPSELMTKAPSPNYNGFIMVSNGLTILVFVLLVGTIFSLMASVQNPFMLVAVLVEILLAYILIGLVRCCGDLRSFFTGQAARGKP